MRSRMREGSKTEGYLFLYVSFTSYVAYVQCKSLERKRRRRRDKSANQNSKKILVKCHEENKQSKLLLSAGHYLPKEHFSVI